MSSRFIVTGRGEHAAGATPESEELRVVAGLDRGLLVDADADQAARLERGGWRVKALPHVHRLRLFSYEIDTERGVRPPLPPQFGAPAAGGDAPVTNHLIQLAGPVQESWLSVLAEHQVRLVEPVGPFGFFVRADQAAVDRLGDLPFVAWTGPLEPAYKVNPVLLGPDDAAAGQGLGPIEAIDIGVLADGDVAGVAALVTAAGGTIRHTSPESTDVFRSITAEGVPADGLPKLAAHDDVRWIDAVRTPVPEDERTAQIVLEDLTSAAAPNTAPNPGYAANLTDLGVDGSGVTIAICDTGIDTNDPATVHDDLAGRLAFAVDADGSAVAAGGDTDGHGTHVAGIAAGDGASGDLDPQGFLLGQGVAPGADVGLVRSAGTEAERLATSAQHGATVMNNSYALSGNQYSAADRAFDLGVRDADPAAAGQTPLVVVFSSGNSGPGAGSLTKTAKNAIIVGNSLNFRPSEGDVDDIRGLRSSSSRGPANDGRRLPQFVAPGTDVVSALSSACARPPYTDTGGTLHAGHTSLSGTSMAAPHVSGLSALLIDWWRQTRDGHTPSPALVKALLTASTEPVEGGADGAGGALPAGPGDDAGFGRVSLENSLLQAPASDRGPKIFVDQRHAFTASGQEYTIRVAAADPAQPLRVALAWTDAAAAVGASPALVNDLDLEVRSVAGGQLYRGNVYSGAFSATGGAADSLNNVETAAIQNPSGVYEITVVAANVAASARTDIATPWQDFALVIDNAEVPAADPVSVVTVLDRSGSMQAFGYVDIAQQTSRQFVGLLGVDDAVGVVSFGDSAIEEYPATGAPEPITGQAVRDAASAAVDGVAFGGCTFMGAGIETGGAMLAGSGIRRAMVLLSDGFDNKGCDPTNPARPSALEAAAALPGSLPIYSCAMGPASDAALLAQLADDTGGRYYFMPTIDDLFEIYNYIRGQVTGDGVIVNETSMASRSQVSGWVDGCAESALFTVAWHAPSLRYVSRDPRGRRDIAVRLRTPGGRWLPRSATEFVRTTGDGYVSFAIQDPQPGLWTVEVETARAEHTPYTVGGFVRSPLRLGVATPLAVAAGEPIALHASVTQAGAVLTGARLQATVAAPRLPLADLVERHRGDLSRIRIPDGLRADGLADGDRARLAQLVLLRDEVRKAGGDDLLAPRVRSLPLSPAKATTESGRRRAEALLRARATVGGPGGPGAFSDPRVVQQPRDLGTVVGRHDRTLVAGSYSLAVTASGFSPVCGTRFVRREFVSVAVGQAG